MTCTMHIDYISMSFTHKLSFPEKAISEYGMIAIDALSPVELAGQHKPEKSERVHQNPYRHGAQWHTGFRIFWGGHDTLLAVLTGRGCKNVDTIAYIKRMMSDEGMWSFVRLTRLDIACDYDTDITPFDAVSKWRINARIKTRNVNNSQSGQTFYVGHKSSDRFCRVYRYHPPHPRSKSLRVEFEFHKNVAEKVLKPVLLGQRTIGDVYHTAWSKTFHESPDSEFKEVDISRSSERNDASTVVWLHKQVVPALARLLDSGEITWSELVEKIQERMKSV